MSFRRKFFFSQCRKNQQGNPSVLCFRNFLVARIFMDKIGGISRVSVESFLSDSAEKFRSGTVQCVINFGYRKILRFRGLCNDFLSRIFCLTVPKHIVGEPFCVLFQKTSGSDKVYAQEEGGWRREYQDFLSKVFCLTVPKKKQGKPSTLCFRKLPVAKKLWIRGERSIKSFRRIVLSDCAERFRMGIFNVSLF